jgi:hypothetical protein
LGAACFFDETVEVRRDNAAALLQACSKERMPGIWLASEDRKKRMKRPDTKMFDEDVGNDLRAQAGKGAKYTPGNVVRESQREE